MNKRFENKVVIATGAASGIWEATAIEFAKEGAHVVLSDISDKGLAVSEKLNNEGYSTIFVKTNVADENDIINLVNQTVEKFGRLDVMFANAGSILNLRWKTWKLMIGKRLLMLT